MPPSLKIAMIDGPPNGRMETRTLTGVDCTLGRAAGTDWTLPDPEQVLSRRHCTLSVQGGEWCVTDESANGTFLNREADCIGQGETRRLRDGDRLRVGPYEFQVQVEENRASTGTESPFGTPAGFPPATSGHNPSGHNPSGHNPFDTPARSSAPSDFFSPPPSGRPFEDSAVPFAPTGAAHNPFDSADDDFAVPDLAAPTAVPSASSMAGGGFGHNPFDEAADRISHDRPLPRPDPGEVAKPQMETGVWTVPRDIRPAAPPTADSWADTPAVAPLQPTAPVEVPEWTPKLPTNAPPAPPVVAVPAPAQPTPPVSSPGPAASPAAPAATDHLLAAFLQGAGIPDSMPKDPVQSMQRLGEAFRAMVVGLRGAQMARRTVRSGFRINQTGWTNNPLKVAVSDERALEDMIGAGRHAVMPPARAVEEVLQDIALHEVATVAAMQDAVRSMLESLEPAKLRAEAEKGGGLSLMPGQRKARAWDTFEVRHAAVVQGLEDDFDSVFGRAFARAYERALTEARDKS